MVRPKFILFVGGSGLRMIKVFRRVDCVPSPQWLWSIIIQRKHYIEARIEARNEGVHRAGINAEKAVEVSGCFSEWYLLGILRMSQPPTLRRCGMEDGSKIHFVLVVVDLMKMIKEISYRVFIITVPTAALAWTRVG